MIRFSQQDPRWANEKLGHGQETIKTAGCLVTCLAMACQARGYSETPATINAKFKATGGGFYGSWIGLSTLPSAVPGMKYLYRYECINVPAPINEINRFLQDGNIVAALVDYDPDTTGIQQHWVILERQAGDDYLILDPWPLKENTGAVTLLGRFGKGKTSAEAIYDVCVFGSAPSTSSGTIPVAEPVEAEESPEIPATELPKAGQKFKPVVDYVNDRYPKPSIAALDVGDIRAGTVVTLSGDAVIDNEGSIWGPHTETHWVCIKKKDVPLMEKVP